MPFGVADDDQTGARKFQRVDGMDVGEGRLKLGGIYPVGMYGWERDWNGNGLYCVGAVGEEGQVEESRPEDIV